MGYVLLYRTLSPNKQFGVIFPNRELEGQPDFVVDAKQGRVLGEVRSDDPFFEHKNRADFQVYWASDNKALLVENDARWGPEGSVVIELRNGGISRQTDICNSLSGMFSPAIARAEHNGSDRPESPALELKSVAWRKAG